MAKTQDLIAAGQQRGITMSEDDEGAWHGSFVHDGQEYTLDNESLEGLAADMNALVDILEQDDTYTIDYNEDTDRYIVTANGFNDPFTDQVLAKAFASAQKALEDKMRKQEEERKAREPKPAKPAKAAAGANGPKEPQGSAVAVGDLPVGVSDAVVRLINALTDLITGANTRMSQGQGEGFVAAGAEQPPPAKPSRKRGLGKS